MAPEHETKFFQGKIAVYPGITSGKTGKKEIPSETTILGTYTFPFNQSKEEILQNFIDDFTKKIVQFYHEKWLYKVRKGEKIELTSFMQNQVRMNKFSKNLVEIAIYTFATADYTHWSFAPITNEAYNHIKGLVYYFLNQKRKDIKKSTIILLNPSGIMTDHFEEINKKIPISTRPIATEDIKDYKIVLIAQLYFTQET